MPKGIPCFTVDEAEKAAETIMSETGASVVVVKAQIHAGGRGKGGRRQGRQGRRQRSAQRGREDPRHAAHYPPDRPRGQKVKRLYVEQGIDIARELYLGLVVDRETRKIAVMASTEGGVEIEKVAEETPEKILIEFVDPTTGLGAYQARKLAYGLEVGKGTPDPKATNAEFVKLDQQARRAVREGRLLAVRGQPAHHHQARQGDRR